MVWSSTTISQSCLFSQRRKHKLFQLRQAWERRARATFSNTIRRHMRDPQVYGRELAWSEAEAACAEILLATVRANPNAPDDMIVDLCMSGNNSDNIPDLKMLLAVWTRLCMQYPHLFAVAGARKQLPTLGLDGVMRQ